MAQQVRLMGATYNDVPQVMLPDANNTLHAFTDVSDTTAAAADVASGKYFFLADGTKQQGTASGGGLVHEEGTWKPESDIARPTISFTGTHTSSPVYIMFADMTGTADGTARTSYYWIWTDPWRKWGQGVPYTNNELRYVYILYAYRGTTANSAVTLANTQLQYTSDTSGSSSATYPKYWCTNTSFKPYTGSTSRYWRAGRTYKWIAIW